jgi:hypothetical protein
MMKETLHKVEAVKTSHDDDPPRHNSNNSPRSFPE